MNSKKPITAVVSALILILTLFSYKSLDDKGKFPWQPKFTKGSYQAVFLSNGQVYFGKISDLGGEYVKLHDIFYLILQRPLQEQTAPAEGEEQVSQYNLIKLGNEMHGPIDEMVISRDRILFIEELKDDGKVVQTIKGYKSGETTPKE